MLGLDSTSALWVESSIREILGRLSDQTLTEELLVELREELNRLGLSEFLPLALDWLEQ